MLASTVQFSKNRRQPPPTGEAFPRPGRGGPQVRRPGQLALPVSSGPNSVLTQCSPVFAFPSSELAVLIKDLIGWVNSQCSTSERPGSAERSSAASVVGSLERR